MQSERAPSVSVGYFSVLLPGFSRLLPCGRGRLWVPQGYILFSFLLPCSKPSEGCFYSLGEGSMCLWRRKYFSTFLSFSQPSVDHFFALKESLRYCDRTSPHQLSCHVLCFWQASALHLVKIILICWNFFLLFNCFSKVKHLHVCI